MDLIPTLSYGLGVPCCLLATYVVERHGLKNGLQIGGFLTGIGKYLTSSVIYHCSFHFIIVSSARWCNIKIFLFRWLALLLELIAATFLRSGGRYTVSVGIDWTSINRGCMPFYCVCTYQNKSTLVCWRTENICHCTFGFIWLHWMYLRSISNSTIRSQAVRYYHHEFSMVCSCCSRIATYNVEGNISSIAFEYMNNLHESNHIRWGKKSLKI